MIRMIVLAHSKTCTVADSTDDIALCLLNIIGELNDAIEKRDLKSFDSSSNLISSAYPSSDTEHMPDFIKEVTEGIMSITDEDSFASFMYRLTRIIGRAIQAQEWNRVVTDARKTERILQFFNVIKECSVHLDL